MTSASNATFSDPALLLVSSFQRRRLVNVLGDSVQMKFGVMIKVDFEFGQYGPSLIGFGRIRFCFWVCDKLGQSGIERGLVGYEGRHRCHQLCVHLPSQLYMRSASGLRRLTPRSLEVVNIHCLRQVSRKSTWSRNS